MEADLKENELSMNEPGFWDDNQKAQTRIKIVNDLKERLTSFSDLEKKYEDLQVALELYDETEDPGLWQDMQSLQESFTKDLENYQLSLLLSNPHDSANAIIEIHPGAGGTESQDWGEMLLRMYDRWAHQKGFKVTVIDYQNGEEAGIKSVTLEIEGSKVYGHLKSEKGVHRLIRISPFDSNGKRHTSFCSIDVTPLIDDSIEVEINPDDLRIDTYRASGAGGQHVNKTSSAVRITHLPTGIVTQSQAQRSQIHNKEQAMNLLKSKLFQLEEERKQKELAAIKGEQLENAWGSQIRSYVFHPYSMVKDHRTGCETGNAEAVLDGDLDDFIDAFLKWQLES